MTQSFSPKPFNFDQFSLYPSFSCPVQLNLEEGNEPLGCADCRLTF